MDKAEHKNARLLKHIYTVVILFSPILHVYGVSQSLHTFSLREVCFLLIAIIIFVSKKVRVDRSLHQVSFVFLFYVFIFALLSFVLETNQDVSILRVIRYILLNAVVLLFAFHLFDVEIGLKVFKCICIVSTVFLIIQIVSFKFFRIYLPGFISFLPIRQSGFAESPQYVISNIESISTVRFSSFFEEPAYYASYICSFLTMYIWSGRKLSLALVVFLSMGVLLSTSILGICTLAFVLFLMLLSNQYSFSTIGRRKAKLYVIIAMLFALVVVINTAQFNALLERIYLGSQSINNRFFGYSMYFDSLHHMSIWNFLFGNSMAEQNLIIVSGYVVIPYYFGIVGVVLFYTILIILFKYSRLVGMTSSFLLILFLNIGSGEFAAGGVFLIVVAFELGKLNLAREYLRRTT